MKKQRIVITGYGVISSLGKNKIENERKIFDGQSGIKEHSFDYVDGKKDSMSGVIENLEVHSFFDNFNMRYDRASNLALHACEECLQESKIFDTNIDTSNVGVVIGTSLGGMLSADTFHTQWIHDGIAAANHEYLRQYPLHAVADVVAKNFKLCGPKAIVSTACSSGANAIGMATDLIKDGMCDMVLVGGVDPISRFSFAGFSALKAIDLQHCSPYSGSTGINLGEGAAFFFVESYEHAMSRNAKIVAEVMGYGLSADAYHPTAPDVSGNGAVRSMKMALEDAGYTIDDISYINGHGTGTPSNDHAEVKAWKSFCDGRKDIPIISNKASIGHCMGAAGAIEIAFSLMSIEKGIIPPTINFTNNEEDIDFVPNDARKSDVKAVISNSFAFGGNNCSVLISKPNESVFNNCVLEGEIVITGIGCLGVGGANINELFSTFELGKDCITEINVSGKDYQSRYVGEFPEVSYKNFISSRILRRIDGVTKLAMVSGRQALSNSALVVTPTNTNRIGVIYGTGTGPLETIEDVSRSMIIGGTQGVNANIFPNTVLNAAPGQFSINNMLKGVTSTLSAGSISGLEAFIYATMLLKQNKADAIVVVTADEWNEALQVGNDKLGLLSHNGAKPFSAEASGMILSQGSTAFVLERKKHAISRNANILARVYGYSLTSDNAELSGFSDEKAWNLCMKKALKMARCEEIDYYASTAYGIPNVDDNELALIRSVLNDNTIVRSIPAMIGAASGSIGTYGLLSCIYSLINNKAPAVVQGDAGYRSEYKEIIKRQQVKEISYAGVGATSFGGAHACVIIGKDSSGRGKT